MGSLFTVGTEGVSHSLGPDSVLVTTEMGEQRDAVNLCVPVTPSSRLRGNNHFSILTLSAACVGFPPHPSNSVIPPAQPPVEDSVHSRHGPPGEDGRPHSLGVGSRETARLQSHRPAANWRCPQPRPRCGQRANTNRQNAGGRVT